MCKLIKQGMRAELMMIPSDIIPEILCRLPSKSIGRFRSVSKEWLCLLTQPEFIKTHGKTLNRNHHIFADKGRLLYSHPFDDHDPIIILNPSNKLPIGLFEDFRGSCDGLVLVSQRQDTNKYFDTVVLLNPTTREFVQLPRPPVRYNPYCEYVRITHGVGYDIVRDDYKVITLTYFDFERDWNKMRLSIYSLRSNTWRHHPITDSPDYDCSYSPASVYAYGFIHWIGRNKNGISVVVAFSLVDDCFSHEVPPPDLCNDTHIMSGEHPRLVLFDGKLAVYKNPDHTWIHTDFELWLMNEYGVKESWTKIPLDIFDYKFPMWKTVIFYDNGKIRVASEKKAQMLIYDPEKKKLCQNVFVWSRVFRPFGSYVESLVSLKGKDATDGEQIVDSLTERQHAGSKASEACITKRASLRRKCDEGKGKVKDEKRSKNS